MADSIPFEQIVSLGNKIIREFNQDQSVDTLGRWMACRIAELIERAGLVNAPEAEAARRECSKLILDLWSKRRLWPNDDPFSDTRQVLKALKPTSFCAPDNNDVASGDVFALLGQFDKLAQVEYQFMFNAALLELDFEVEKQYLEDHRNLMPARQIRNLEILLERVEEVRKGSHFHHFQPQLHKMNKSERRQAIAQFMSDSLRKRDLILQIWLSGSTE